MSITVVATIADLKEHSARLLAERTAGGAPGTLGFVPTMGALHAGHGSLMAAAAAENTVVVASVFVNPLQFGDATDLARYPRTADADRELLEAAGVDVMFAPSVAEMYPHGDPAIRVSAGALGELYEGASRPGHFDGALTVVAKLLHLGRPDTGLGAADAAGRPAYRAYFGQKDAQQVALVRRMVADLDFPVEIVSVPTLRGSDGLALSSRNRFLSEAEHGQALVLSRALRLLADRAAARDPLRLAEVTALVADAPGVHLDYLHVVDPLTLAPLPDTEAPLAGPALAIIAAGVGPVRLIDNLPLG